MEIIIEEISKGHKLIGRHKYAQSSVKVGRAYSNDIILTDPHICPEHLTLVFDGDNWIVRDENSLNGSFVDQTKHAADGHIVQSGDVISIGNSQIRLLFPHHPVEESVPFSPYETLINWARNPVVITLSILIFAACSAWLNYLDKPKDVSFPVILIPAIGMTLMFSAWPALVAMISHFTKNDARVLHQIGICFIFYLLLLGVDIIQSLLLFNTSSNWPIHWITGLLPVAIAFCLFWLNCYIGFHMSKSRRVITAASLTILFFGGSALIQLSKQPEFNPRPQYNATILPPALLWSRSNDVDGFLIDAEKLFDKTRKEGQKDKE